MRVLYIPTMHDHLWHTVDSPHKGHFGTGSLSFVRRLSSLGGSKCTGATENILRGLKLHVCPL